MSFARQAVFRRAGKDPGAGTRIGSHSNPHTAAIGNQALQRLRMGGASTPERRCSCGAGAASGGECTACRRKRESAMGDAAVAPMARGVDGPDHAPERGPDDERPLSSPMAVGATTPDGVDLGPTDTSKNVCQSRFWATTSVQRNTAAAAQGRQDITFRAANAGTTDEVSCDCGCPVYRHWIKGYWRLGSATAAKRYDISSCGNPLTINESSLTEEYTTCIGDNDANACRWAYADAPGLTGLTDGTYVELHYDFVYQIWDRCQGRSVAAARRSLDISGDTAPRTITWSVG